MFIATSRWIGFRLDFISGLLLHAFTYLTMAMRGSVPPALLALALSQVRGLFTLTQRTQREERKVENKR
jgi:hypothetical protein